MHVRKYFRWLPGLALAAGLAVPATLAAVAPASAGTVVATGTTHIINVHATTGAHPGDLAYAWANQNFDRTLTVSREDSNVCASDSNLATFHAATEFCYTATITDSGTFTTLVNARQPNQGFTTPSGNTIHNVVSGSFSGGASWIFEETQAELPDSSNILASLDQHFNADPTGLSSRDQTLTWFLQAFQPSVTSVDDFDLNADWSWTYKTDCNEQWKDAGSSGAGNNGFGGQSTPLTIDGNITGLIPGNAGCTPDVVTVTNPGNQNSLIGASGSLAISASASDGDTVTSCSATGLPAGTSISNSCVISGTLTTVQTTTVTVTASDNDESGSTAFTWTVHGLTVTPPPGNYGDNVNPFGNGFDVFRQHGAVNAIVAGWPATQHDPATHFLRHAGTVAGAFQYEYAPSGTGTGLCVSDPGFDAAGTGLRDGLVLRGCNTGPWQQFVPQAGGTLRNVATGLVVNPNGKGAQLRGGTAAVPWGGSVYVFTQFASLPA